MWNEVCPNWKDSIIYHFHTQWYLFKLSISTFPKIFTNLQFWRTLISKILNSSNSLVKLIWVSTQNHSNKLLIPLGTKVEQEFRNSWNFKFHSKSWILKTIPWIVKWMVERLSLGFTRSTRYFSKCTKYFKFLWRISVFEFLCVRDMKYERWELYFGEEQRIMEMWNRAPVEINCVLVHLNQTGPRRERLTWARPRDWKRGLAGSDRFPRTGWSRGQHQAVEIGRGIGRGNWCLWPNSADGFGRGRRPWSIT